jgi:hypothetical protein
LDFGSSALSQANGYCFARKRGSFFWALFFVLTREKKSFAWLSADEPKTFTLDYGRNLRSAEEESQAARC